MVVYLCHNSLSSYQGYLQVEQPWSVPQNKHGPMGVGVVWSVIGVEAPNKVELNGGAGCLRLAACQREARRCGSIGSVGHTKAKRRPRNDAQFRLGRSTYVARVEDECPAGITAEAPGALGSIST